MVFQHFTLLPLSTVQQAASMALEFSAVILPDQDVPTDTSSIPSSVSTHQWRPPELTHLQLNIDGSWHQESDSVGIRVVVRNANGDFLAAMAMRKLHVANGSFGSSGRKKESNSKIGIVIADIRSLQGEVHVFSCGFIGRSGNSVAYELAQQGSLLESSEVWLEDPLFGWILSYCPML
ncbi:hypothetical protein F0562_006110 [Nyssa sinensis]|uniref:RNase H type-1 domain-containing protein n=1 Tax=Nyssa sinensis TaxID=561372 RepID=A0A5J5AM85_9ASTE|nr:hypothetical protein F0562_006110 [Nyssa sinensis]